MYRGWEGWLWCPIMMQSPPPASLTHNHPRCIPDASAAWFLIMMTIMMKQDDDDALLCLCTITRQAQLLKSQKWMGCVGYRWKSLNHCKHLLRDAEQYQNGLIFGKVPKGGVGSFSIQKFILQICAIIDDTSVMNFRKNITFRKWGGDQRPFGTLPKINPFWYCSASLT